MDTNGYEAFEYLQPDSVEADQLFVVQENGTFLRINRPVEFVTQMQNVENVLEEVQPMYDVAPQQFYVDVNGSPELITVPDEFTIPTEGNNNMYGNNFLLQQASNSEVQIQQNVNQIAENVVEQLISPEISVPMDVNINDNIDADSIQSNGCTEITITDEQYKLLQEKGWILLETNDKAYLIDTLGLRDITNNNQLIQKLRVEMAHGDTSYTESFASNEIETKIKLNEGIENNIKSKQTLVPYVPESSEQMTLQVMDIQSYPSIEEDPENVPNCETKELPDLMPLEKVFLETTVNELSEKYEKSDPRINSNTIKIKTKFSLSEIPPEIILGRTVNGKKLVARVTKTKEPVASRSADASAVTQKRKPKTYPTISAFHQKIERLIQQAVRGNVSALSDSEVSAGAHAVIQQLLRVPAFKPAVIERKLIITKIVLMEDKDQTSTQERDPIIITGRVVKQHEKDRWGFQYIPDMLQKIRENNADDTSTAVKRQNGGDIDIAFLQIHIQEVQSPDGVARISISLNKRVILLKSKKITDSREMQEKQAPSPRLHPVYACTACAALFKTEYRLRCHQQTHKTDYDFDSLVTIDTRSSMKPYNVVKIGHKTEYICTQCQHKTTRISMMLRHIKSHFNVAVEDICEEDKSNTNKISQGKFKCKMCSTNFLYASTLSKHILSKHIKVS